MGGQLFIFQQRVADRHFAVTDHEAFYNHSLAGIITLFGFPGTGFGRGFFHIFADSVDIAAVVAEFIGYAWPVDDDGFDNDCFFRDGSEVDIYRNSVQLERSIRLISLRVSYNEAGQLTLATFRGQLDFCKGYGNARVSIAVFLHRVFQNGTQT